MVNNIKLFSATALVYCLCNAALAGDIVEEQPQAEIMPAPAPTSAWDGLYAGLSYGSHYTLESGPPDGSDYDMYNPVVGAFVGYTHVLPNSIALGVEVAFSRASGVQGAVNDSFLGRYESTYTELKLSVGYDLGQALISGFFGWTDSNYDFQNDAGESYTSGVGDDHSGYHLGARVDYLVTENVFIGIEYVYRDLPGQDGNLHDIEDQSVALRFGMLF
jgi:outer membrane immunogenic protein